MQFRLPVYGKPECIRQPICAHADDGCTASLSAQCIKRSCCTFVQQLLPFLTIEYFLSHSNCYDFKASDRNFHTSRLHLQFSGRTSSSRILEKYRVSKEASFLIRRTVGSPEQLTKRAIRSVPSAFSLRLENIMRSPSQVSQDFSAGRVMHELWSVQLYKVPGTDMRF